MKIALLPKRINSLLLYFSLITFYRSKLPTRLFLLILCCNIFYEEIMNKKQIEDLSVNAVCKSISLTDYLSPYINNNDKEPSWDGLVIIHSDKNCTKNDIKRVLVQVKGKKCDDFSKSEISFPAETSDLRNYLNNGGIIYFVVYLKRDGTEKIYYSTLTPVKLKKYLKNIGTQKSKNINLKEFPEDSNKKMNIFVNFFENCKKQVSFVDIGFISLDKLNQEGVKEVTMSLTWYDCKDTQTDIREMFFETEVYLYAKIDGSKALHPVDTVISSISFPEKVQEPISIDGKTYYSSFSRTRSKDKVELKIGDSLLITICKKDSSIKVTYKDAKMLRTRVKDLDFFLNAMKAKYFYLNDKKIYFEVPANEQEKFSIPNQLRILEYYQKVLQLFNILNVKEDISLEELTDEDYKNLDILIKAFIENKPVKNLNKNLFVLKLKLANLRLLLMFIKSEKTETMYEIEDFFNSGKEFFYDDGNGNMLRAPAYSYLRKDDYLQISNINYDDILPSYKALQDTNEGIFGIANYDMLQILLAYDESKPKKDELLSVSKEIAEWILQEDKTNLPTDIKILNFLQIIKRERQLSREEKNSLLSMTQNSSVRDDIKVAAYLLLDNHDLAEFCFQKMDPENQESFKNFPIYYFWRDEVQNKIEDVNGIST